MNPVHTVILSDNDFLPFAWINSNNEMTKANKREQTCSGQYMSNLYQIV